MKTLLLLILSLNLGVGTLIAQKITLKSVSPLPLDLTVQNDPNARKDGNGKPCALIRVGIVGVEDLVFPDAIGKVKRSLSEYLVYVPERLEHLRYHNQDGTISGEVSFVDNGIEEVESKKVYSVVFESDSQLRAAIISVKPKSATLTFDGATIQLDEEGMGTVLKPIGTYSYSVQATGYEPVTGRLLLTEDDISSTANVVLRPKQYPLLLTCEPPTAKLTIDGHSYGSLNTLRGLQITEGKHTIRLTAEGYDDYENMLICAGEAQQLNVQLLKKKAIVDKKENTKTNKNIRTGIYLHLGADLYDKEKYYAHTFGLKGGINVMHHFGRIFALREGIHLTSMALNDSLKSQFYKNINDGTSTSWALEVPLQVGLSIPVGQYNQHLITVLAGGYGRSIFTDVEKDSEKKSKTTWDFGLRLSAMVDIKKFVIQAEVNKSLKEMGMYYGLTIGWRFTNIWKMMDDISDALPNSQK